MQTPLTPLQADTKGGDQGLELFLLLLALDLVIGAGHREGAQFIDGQLLGESSPPAKGNS